MHRTALLLMVLGFIALIAPASLSAQAPPAVADVVRLHDGGFVRGVIVEQSTGSHVAILLPDGTTRRIESADISYAGPADLEPSQQSEEVVSAPDAGVTGSPAPTQSTFATTGENLRLFSVRSGAPADALCALPCVAHLAPGEWQFAIAREEGEPRIVDERFQVDGPASFRIEWADREAMRIAGWILLGVGSAVGIGVALPGLAAKVPCSLGTCGSVDWALAGPGLAIVGVSVGVGLALGLSGDGVDIDLDLGATGRP